MKNIIVTGLGVEDLIKFQNHGKKSCFLCKRKEGNESIIFDECDEEYRTGKIDLTYYEVSFEDVNMRYLLCVDCYMLLTYIAKTSNFSQVLKAQLENKN